MLVNKSVLANFVQAGSRPIKMIPLCGREKPLLYHKVKINGEMMFKLKYMMILMIAVFFYTALDACTIGIASADITEKGKPMIWKTRDRGARPHNQVYYNTNYEHNFVSVVDTIETKSWMGVNEQGFAILNSAAHDLQEEREFGNGQLMEYALGTFATVAEFEEYLVSSNGHRLTWANFAVMDSIGEVAIFETSSSTFWRFDAGDSEAGWLVRTNFSENGGGALGLDRYSRTEDIISKLVDEDELTAENLYRDNLRDLSNEHSGEIMIPFEGHDSFGKPYGYFDTRNSISNYSSVSGAVIQGVLPDADPRLSVMYTALGNPLFTPAVPVFPIGQPSEYLYNPLGLASFNEKSLEFKEIFYSNAISYLIDTFCLESEYNTFLEDLLDIEEDMFEETEDLINDFSAHGFTVNEINNFQEETYSSVYQAYQSMVINTDPVPDFSIISAVPLNDGIAAQFSNDTTHNPQFYQWDFNNDGETDSFSNNPNWLFPEEGNYIIVLKALVDGEVFSVSKEVNIIITSSAEVDLGPTGFFKIKAMQNPFYRNSDVKQNFQINFSISKATELVIDVYNIRGEKVQRLVDRRYTPGEYQVRWNLKNKSCKPSSSGIYIFSFSNDYNTEYQRLVLF